MDVGCGTGRLLRKAKQQWPNAQLIGVDAAEKMIERQLSFFQKRNFTSRWLKNCLCLKPRLTLPLAPFHFTIGQIKLRACHEVARVLRPQGKFLLADITIPFGLSLFVKNFKYNSPAKLHEMFTHTGLTVELQQRPWRWLRFILITVGRKPST